MESQMMIMRQTSEIVDEVLGEIHRAFSKEGEKRGDTPISELRSKMIVILDGLMSHSAYGPILRQLREHDDYTFRHSIGVAILSMWIGQSYNLGRKDLRHLTYAALLHDVGKIKIPSEILQKPGALTEDQFYLMRFHCEYGYEMLMAAVPSDIASEEPSAGHASAEAYAGRIAKVALQHHEREDGSGYPYNLTAKSIDLWSKIVAVADVFHAMISLRPYKSPATALNVLQMMADDECGALDRNSVLCLQRKAMAILMGDQVRLSNGTVGRIVMIPHHAPTQPIVEVNGVFIDLSRHPELTMECLVNTTDSDDTDDTYYYETVSVTDS